MTITKKLDGENLIVSLEGRLDTNTSPELEKELDNMDANVKYLTMDMTQLAYMSSAGLRVMLSIHKKMISAGGSFKLINVNEDIMEVFEITGFIDVLTIE